MRVTIANISNKPKLGVKMENYRFNLKVVQNKNLGMSKLKVNGLLKIA